MFAATTNIYSNLKNLLRTEQTKLPQVDPDLFIVDISFVLREYSQLKDFAKLYRLFPLQDIVQCVLSVNAYEDHGEFFWNELENRIMAELTAGYESPDLEFDYDKLASFHELLCCFLEEFIRSKLPQSVDTAEYVFARWLGNTSIMFQKDRNAMSCNRSM